MLCFFKCSHALPVQQCPQSVSVLCTAVLYHLISLSPQLSHIGYLVCLYRGYAHVCQCAVTPTQSAQYKMICWNCFIVFVTGNVSDIQTNFDSSRQTDGCTCNLSLHNLLSKSFTGFEMLQPVMLAAQWRSDSN